MTGGAASLDDSRYLVRHDRRRTAGAAAVVVAFGLPLLFLVLGSFRPAGEPPPAAPELVPPRFTLDNYAGALDHVPLGRNLVNSLVVAAVAVPLSVLVGWWAGFAITRLSRRWSTVMVGASVVALMIPPTAMLVGRFSLFDALGVTDTLLPLMAPALISTSPLYTLLFVWAVRRIPVEMLDVARIEGLSAFQTWRHVVVPLTKRTGIAVAVLSFVATWSNFLDPLVYLSNPDTYTLPLGLKALSQIEKSDQPMILAGAVMVTLPVILAFLAVQRSFVQRPADIAAVPSLESGGSPP